MKKYRCSCGRKHCVLGSYGNKYAVPHRDKRQVNTLVQLQDDLLLLGRAFMLNGQRIDPTLVSEPDWGPEFPV